MQIQNQFNITCKRIFVLCLLFLSAQSLYAMSRMGEATITDLEGIPCFSIPSNFETRKGLPLSGIFISELPDGLGSELPPYVWSIKATNYDSLPTLHPKKCVRYGDIPDGTSEHILKPLELLKVYSVFVQAKHEGSSMIGYSGEFCLKPDGSGRTSVQVISEDRSLGDARFAGCNR